MENITARREIGRKLDGPLAVFELGDVIAKLKAEADWRKEGRNSIILHKREGLRVVVVAMHAGNVIQPHRAGHPITVQVLEGKLLFTAGGDSRRLRKGEVLVLEGGLQHGVEALEESAFLLTIAG